MRNVVVFIFVVCAIAVDLSSCKCRTRDDATTSPRALLESSCMCPCACDAPPADASPDASIVIDLATAWTMRVQYGASLGGTLTGADGTGLGDVNGDGRLDEATAFEESARVGAFISPACGAPSRDAWTPVLFAAQVQGAEDAIIADVDGDGRPDVIASGSGDLKIHIWFAPEPSLAATASAWPHIAIAASQGVSRWMRAAVADLDHQGGPDVAACGYSTGAKIGYFTSATPRDGASWTWHEVGLVGACQEMVARDVDADGWMDLALSDRDTIYTTPPTYNLRGSRWLRNPAGTGGQWVNNTIASAPPSNARWSWFSPSARDVVHGTANGATPNVNTLSLFASTNGVDWVSSPLPVPMNIGWYHASARADIDGDGDLDLVVSSSTADGDLEGVVWMRANADGTWSQGKVSGAPGCKFDNLAIHDVDCDGDLDIMTTEQGCSGGGTPFAERLGVIWYENPRF